jgi:hypothetical protein
MFLDGLWNSHTGRKERRSGIEVWTWDLHITECGCCNLRYFFQILSLRERFEGPTVMNFNITFPWDVKPCGQIKIHRRFECIFCLIPANAGKFLPDYTALLPRRQIIFVRVIRKESNCAFVSNKYEAARLATCTHMTCGQNIHTLTTPPPPPL